MNINFPNLSNIKYFQLGNNNKPNNISFTSDKDVFIFSDKYKERLKIIKELEALGIDEETANDMVRKYCNTEEYKKHVNGIYDPGFDKVVVYHNVGFDRNLTPTEAVVYQAYDMDDYYMQYFDCYPDTCDTCLLDRVSNYDIGKGSFSPLELVPYLCKGYDIVTSGMIVKGDILEEEAENANKYYQESHENFKNSLNVKLAESTFNLILENLDVLKYLTSDEKDAEGKCINDLIRPLTTKEATSVVICNYPQDSHLLNNYIVLNNEFGYSLADVSLMDYWNKTPEDIRKEREEARELAKKKKENASKIDTSTLQGRIKYLMERSWKDDLSGYEVLMLLDDEKYRDRLPYKTIEFDFLMISIFPEKELIRENIQVLNSISEELLEKMAPSKSGKKGRFASLSRLLKNKNLKERVEALETYRIQSPKLFSAIETEQVMDYLSDSTLYSDMKRTKNEFYNSLYEIATGETVPEPKKAQILDFKKKNN